MQRKLSTRFRAVIFMLSLAMVAVLYFPIWKIELAAPQYPEGLTLKIAANGLRGDVDIVNGLNHYIGMQTLHTEDFLEFKILPFIIGGLAVLGFVAGAMNNRKLYYAWVALFLLVAVVAMVDFYRWEYNYGHHLNPEAPIRVPGMAYQPPLLGYKQLLNFGAYSIPDVGGWIFIGVGAALVLLSFKFKKGFFVIGGLMLGLQSCSTGPAPIRYGQDACDFCKMGFSDKRFGAEIVTKKGKVFKYDDVHCLLAALKAGGQEIGGIYLLDFTDGQWIKAEDSRLLHSTAFHSPMGSDIAAFADSVHLKAFNGESLTWKELYR